MSGVTTNDTAGSTTESARSNRDIVSILSLAAVCVTVIWLAIIVLWPAATSTLVFDDAFYYLGIAENLAGGSGSTFDGINETNGYHPLWMLILTGLFAAGVEGDSATRAALGIQIVAGWGAALLVLAQIAGRSLARWPRFSDQSSTTKLCSWTLFAGTVLFAGNPYVVKVFVNGMEAAIAASLGAVIIWIAVVRQGRWLGESRTLRSQLGAGAVLALAFLARTDAALLLASLGVWVVVEIARTPSRQGRRRNAMLQAVALLGPAWITVITYLAYNHIRFDTWLQISGLVKRAELSPRSLIGFGLFLLTAGWLLRRSVGRILPTSDAPEPADRRGRFPIAGRFVAMTSFYAAFCVMLIGYYSLLQTQQWLWYYAPLAFYGLCLFVLGGADILDAALRDAPKQMTSSRALLPYLAIVVLPVAVGLAISVPNFIDPNIRSIIDANEEAGIWIDANLDEGSVVASWDAGMLGYSAGGGVVNLDGVVNSHDYYLAMQSGYGPLGEFLACEGVTHLANHASIQDGTEGDPGMVEFIAKTWGDEVADGSVLVHEVPFTFSGTTVGSKGHQRGGEKAVFIYELPGDPSQRC